MSALDVHLEVGHPLTSGALALYPLFGPAAEAPDYLPGPVAAAQGALRVEERAGGPRVAELSVTNTATRPVLLVEGEGLLGGWQNRSLNVSVILAAGAASAVPVPCVERGRWGGARLAPSVASPALRARKQRAASADVMAGGAGRRSDQHDVSQAVDEYAYRLGAPSPTQALDDVFEVRAADVGDLVAGTEPLAGQRVRSVDVFDRPSTLGAYWPSLGRAYALDGLDVAASMPPGRSAVAAAFDALRAAPTRRVTGAGLGEEVHAQHGLLTAAALVREGAVVHLRLFLDDPAEPAPGHRSGPSPRRPAAR